MPTTFTPFPPTVEKSWGVTRPLRYGERDELHHASIKKGGYSSRHRHVGKENYFYVLSGTLYIQRYDPDYRPVRLTAGMAYVSPAGEWHRFYATTDVELIEYYWNADGNPIDPDDIERLDMGGIDPHPRAPEL
jgi:mannose-6-phosphate isomerase-like protein (cupin superfamily)